MTTLFPTHVGMAGYGLTSFQAPHSYARLNPLMEVSACDVAVIDRIP